MPVVPINGIKLYYEIHGAGEPLVLIAGLASDISEYAGISEGLAQKYRVVTFDNRGAGRSDKPDIPYSIEMMADDAIRLMDAVGAGRAHIIGISMGGRIALELALQHPDRVDKLVLVSTAPRVVRTWRQHLLFNTLPRLPILKGRYPQPYYAFLRQRRASDAYDCTARLPDLRTPTLILHGRQDKVAPYKQAEEMQALIPDARLIGFDGGHLFLFFKPHEFVATILNAL